MGAAIASSTIAWGNGGTVAGVKRVAGTRVAPAGSSSPSFARPFDKLRAMVDKLANLKVRKQPNAPALNATGIVLDEDGVPAAGVLVDGAGLVGDLENPAPSVITDQDGRFSLPIDLAYGGSVSGMLMASARDLRGAVSLYLTRPGAAGEDLEIKLKKARSIRGTARLAGNAMGGVRISVSLVGSIDERVSPLATAVSAMDGRFEVSVIGPGVYRIDALRSGVFAGVDYVQVLDSGPAPDVLIDLPEGREVVVHAVDDQGLPVAGAKVRTYAMGGPEDAGHIGTTDADGRSLVMVDAGSNATLSIERQGYAPASVQTKDRNAEVVLRRVPQISGIVEAPMDAVTRVWVKRTDPNDYYGGLTPVATLRSPGPFTADLMQEGTYEIVAYVEGVGESVRKPIVASVGSTTQVGTLNVDGGQGSVAGIVSDATGKPVANATVRVSRSELGAGSFTATTDAAGRFTMTDVPMGSYSADTDVGGRYLSTQLTVKPMARTEVSFAPDAEAEYEGDEYEGEGHDYYDEEYEGEDWQPQYTPGVRWGWSDEGLVVLAPTYAEGEPTMPGGLLPGDIIIGVNGQSIDGGEEGLYGKEGSAVRLKVRRPATNQTFETSVARTAMEEEEGGC